MSNDQIPVAHIDSGEKFTNDRGVRVIKDGIKASSIDRARQPKPDWLKMRVQNCPK